VARRKALGAVTVLVLLAIAVPALAAPEGSPRIVNGTAASEGEYPYQVFIEIDAPGGTSFCGGSLVEDRRILTAAHCTTDDFGNALPPSRFLICIGVTDLDNEDADGFNLDNCPNANRYSVLQNHVHPEYGSRGQGQSHDVAMLRLDRAASGTNIAAIRVINASESALVADGVTATITGWGNTSEGGDPPADWNLQEAEVPIVSDSTCAQHYTNFGAPSPPAQEPYDPSTMLCAGNNNKDTCQGDSGGPLVVPDGSSGRVLAGVTSWGEGCNQTDREGVYADLQAELNGWVHAGFPPQPANDDFPAALSLTGTFDSLTGQDNANATREVGEPDHAGIEGGRSLWYTWTAPASGPTSVDTCDGDFDTTIGVYTGSSVSALSEVARDDDSCLRLGGSFAQFVAQAGQTYKIAVDGYEYDSGSFDVYVELLPETTSPPPPPPGPSNNGSGDQTRPSSRVTRRRCARRTCTLLIRVSDPGGVRGMRMRSSVARLNCPRGRRGRRCRRPRSIRARQVSPGFFRVMAGGLKPGRYRFTVVAIDAAGNRQRRPTVVVLRVKRR
jgi:secreted trypsin-like serine protease